MSFWKSERFEYIRQPHIVAIIVVCVLVIAGALFTAFRRVGDAVQEAKKPTEQRCLQYINDDPLCKFIATSETEGFTNVISTTTTTSENSLIINTLRSESPDKIHSITTNGDIVLSEYILYDANGYVKDTSDDQWVSFVEQDFTPSPAYIIYDLTADNTEDVIQFRDKYTYIGKEPCNGLTCYKYRIDDSEDPELTTYLWFDDQDYLMRRHQISDGTNTDNIQYSYEEVKIEVPTTLKQVSQEQLDSLVDRIR